jgi:hypothetical protein
MPRQDGALASASTIRDALMMVAGSRDPSRMWHMRLTRSGGA